jgi:D-tyrosyl-tRNA(Tyr) deacylase
MKAVIQRVSAARVEVGGAVVGSINNGLLVFLGIEKGDAEDGAAYIAKKTARLRIFEDTESKMNLSVKDISGEVLVVSQFTLSADCRKGNRPSFVGAEDPVRARGMYMNVVEKLKQDGISAHTGQFAGHMQVHLVNNVPVTILLDSRK